MLPHHNQGDKKSGLRRYTFVLSAEFSLEREIITHLQQLGQYRTTDALRRFALLGFNWRAGAQVGQPRSAAAPAWAGEAPQSCQSPKKRCWMYLSTRIPAEAALSQMLEPIGADRRAQIIRDLVIDGFWLEKMRPSAIHLSLQAQESIASNGPKRPSPIVHSGDNGDRQIANVHQPHREPKSSEPFEHPVVKATSEVDSEAHSKQSRHFTPGEENAAGAVRIGSMSEAMLVQGAPMQRREGGRGSSASALAALMGGIQHGARASNEQS